jgi:hypothetical protein
VLRQAKSMASNACARSNPRETTACIGGGGQNGGLENVDEDPASLGQGSRPTSWTMSSPRVGHSPGRDVERALARAFTPTSCQHVITDAAYAVFKSQV